MCCPTFGGLAVAKEFKDKLTKLNKKKSDALDVIYGTKCQDKFYDWLKLTDPIKDRKVYSLKRLAKEFLAEFPGYYGEYEKIKNNFAEMVRVAKTPWLDEDQIMRDDMVFVVTISYFDNGDDTFICKKLADVDFFIKDQLNSNNDRNLKSIVIDLADFYEPNIQVVLIMCLWILVYSPVTNEDLIKLAYFKFSCDLEQFTLNNKGSILVHHFECLRFDLSIQGVDVK